MATVLKDVCMHLSPEVNERGACDKGITPFKMIVEQSGEHVSAWKRRLPCFKSNCSYVTCPSRQLPTEQELAQERNKQLEAYNRLCTSQA